MVYLHILTDNNSISCLNEVKDQKTGTWQHHREEMCTATNNGTYDILKNERERCVTIIELSSMCAATGNGTYNILKNTTERFLCDYKSCYCAFTF